jgi:hypothetical protein
MADISQRHVPVGGALTPREKVVYDTAFAIGFVTEFDKYGSLPSHYETARDRAEFMAEVTLAYYRKVDIAAKGEE